MPGSHGTSSLKALIPGTVLVLQLPVSEFGIGIDCCNSNLQGTFQEIEATGTFRGVLGHLGDLPSCEDGPVRPFRVRDLLSRTVYLLYLLHMPHLMVNLNEICLLLAIPNTQQKCRSVISITKCTVTFLDIRTISDQKRSFSSASQAH